MGKQAKLYIPVFKQVKVEGKEDYVDRRVTLLNASKIPILKEIIPDEETLITHMQIQTLKVKKDSKYQPVPFEIFIESSKFTEINKSIQRYDKLANRNHIALFRGWPALPICIISILKQ